MRSPRLLHTEIGWSRWVFGVWAIATVVWLFVAMLMLVHWPETLGRPFEGQTYVGAIPVVGERATKFLLFAAIPPAFLFVLCCAGLWNAGLPFPYSHRVRALNWQRGVDPLQEGPHGAEATVRADPWRLPK